MTFVLNRSGADDEDALHVQSKANSALPFSMNKDASSDALIIHMKCLTSDLKEIEAANVLLNRLVRGQRVNGKDVCVVVTDESVSINIATARALAAFVAPEIHRILGISGIG